MNLAIVDDKRWTDMMDPVADNAAAIIIKNGGLEAMGNALDLLSNEPPDKSWPDGLRGFIDQARVPDGVDQARINVAQEWFTTWSAIGTATLYCASLPETYCLPGIAQLDGNVDSVQGHVGRTELGAKVVAVLADPVGDLPGYPPKMLQEIMGHASITTTLDLYGHLYPGDMDRYADRLDEAAENVSKAKIRPDDDEDPQGAS